MVAWPEGDALRIHVAATSIKCLVCWHTGSCLFKSTVTRNPEKFASGLVWERSNFPDSDFSGIAIIPPPVSV